MTARNVTYSDIDDYLVRLGLERRSVEVDQGGDNARANGAGGAGRTLRPAPGYAYVHAKTGALLMLPNRPAKDEAAPYHLHAVRRTLVDWGVISNDEFDRWLCQARMPNDQSVSTNAVVEHAQATG